MISVVTISYNQVAFLQECIDSVHSQRPYLDIEYIVVDGLSSDGSQELILNNKDKIDVIVIETDLGPADALNKGFARANGDIFFYLNSDDLLFPNALLMASKFFKKNPNVDVLLGSGALVDVNSAIMRLYASRHWSLLGYERSYTSALQQSTFFRRAIFEKTHGFNVKNKSCWDSELLVDMALAGAKFSQSVMLLGKFRIHQESITGSKYNIATYYAVSSGLRKKASKVNHSTNYIDYFYTYLDFALRFFRLYSSFICRKVFLYLAG